MALDLQQGLAYARQELARPKHSFYQKLQQRERGTIASVDTASFTQAVEQGIATAYAVRRLAIGAVSIPLAEAYGMYAAAQVGKSLLGNAPALDAPMRFGTNEYEYLDQLINAISMRIGALPREVSLKEFGASTMHWMEQTAREEGQRTTYAPELQKLPAVELPECTIVGFSQRSKESVYCGSLDDIVGNREVKRVLLGALHQLLCYNPGEKRNPVKEWYDFPETFLIDGKPGTGKTSIARAIAAEGQRLAEKHRKDFRVRSIDGSFKSEYYSASARQLRDLFTEIHRGDAAYLLIADDIDLLFSSRSEMRERGGEDKAVLGEMLNLLEGVGTPQYGNTLLIANTNCASQLDPALAERLRQRQLIATGPETPEDYATLFQKLLNQSARLGASEWTQLGKACATLELSGRTVRNIAQGLLDDTYGGPKPESWIAAPKIPIAEFSLPTLLEHIETYRSMIAAQETRDRTERIASLRAELDIRRAAEECHG